MVVEKVPNSSIGLQLPGVCQLWFNIHDIRFGAK